MTRLRISRSRTTILRILSLFIMLVNLLSPLPLANSTTILSKKYSPNLPMQRSTFHVFDILWIFSFDTSSSRITLQNITSLKKYTRTTPYTIANCSEPYNYDVCLGWDRRFYIVHSPGSENQPLILTIVQPYRNATFEINSTITIAPPQFNTSYTHPSIQMTSRPDLFMSYHNSNDGHLYVVTYVDSVIETHRVSQVPAPVHFSRMIWMPGNRAMLLFSDGETLKYVMFVPSRYTEPEVVASQLSWRGAWSAIWCWTTGLPRPNYGVVVTYHTADGRIVFRQYVDNDKHWLPEKVIQNITSPTIPLVTRLPSKSDYLIVWYNNQKFTCIGGNATTPWNATMSFSGPIPTDSKYISVYHQEVLNHIGLTYESGNGLSFIYFGSDPPESIIKKGRSSTPTPLTFKVLRWFIVGVCTLFVLRKIFLTEVKQ